MRFPFSSVDGFPAGCLPASLSALDPVPSRWNESQHAAHQGMSPEPPRRSAVALLFLPPLVAGVPADVLLIRRSPNYGSHRGQIGLAGGRVEEGDLGPIDTLIRELREELGVPPELLFFHGQLPVKRAIDGSEVVPIVVTTKLPRHGIVPAPDEVADVHFIPWTLLTNSCRSSFVFTMFGIRRESVLYRVDGTTIWGLTASIINEADMLPMETRT